MTLMGSFLPFIEANGATIMLSLLAMRWLWSIYLMLEQASSAGRSVMFDAICVCAYLAGLAQYRAVHGPGWESQTTGAFFFVNLTLIAIDLSLLMRLRWIERSEDATSPHMT